MAADCRQMPIPPLHTIPLAVLPEADAIDEGRLTMDEGEGIDDFRLTMDEGKRIDDFRWTRDEVGDVQRSGLSLPENEHAQAWAANAVGTAQPAEEHAKAPTTNAVTLIAALWPAVRRCIFCHLRQGRAV